MNCIICEKPLNENDLEIELCNTCREFFSKVYKDDPELLEKILEFFRGSQHD